MACELFTSWSGCLIRDPVGDAGGLRLRSIQKIEAGEISLLLTTVLRLKGALKCPWVKLLG